VNPVSRERQTGKQLAFLAIFPALAIWSGCATNPSIFAKRTDSRPTSDTSPSPLPPGPDQQGLANLSYQSVLPVGMVVLLTLLSFHDKMLMGWLTWLSHRREMQRIKCNGHAKP
jgi:hypothetical protein